MLERMAKNDAEKYQSFWTEFGNVIKEGPAEDFQIKKKLQDFFVLLQRMRIVLHRQYRFPITLGE